MTDSDPKPTQSGTYVLGHSDRELDRLSAQARLLNPITSRFLREAGIVRGMSVLDVGTGVGGFATVLQPPFTTTPADPMPDTLAKATTLFELVSTIYKVSIEAS